MLCSQCKYNAAEKNQYCWGCLTKNWTRATRIASTLRDKHDFVEAMSTLRAAYTYEARGADDAEDWLRYAEECDKAIEIYNATILPAQQSCVQQLKDIGLEQYALALENKNYSILEY